MTADERVRKRKAKELWGRWQRVWDNGCSTCDFDEAEGGIVDHCRACTREMALIAIDAGLPKILKRRAA